MPRLQKELSRLQFQRDFQSAQARWDMMEPDDEPEDKHAVSAVEAGALFTHHYSVRHDA